MFPSDGKCSLWTGNVPFGREMFHSKGNVPFGREMFHSKGNTEDFYAVDEKRVPHPGSTWRQQGRIRSFYSPTIPDFNTPYSRFTKYGAHRPMFIRYMRSFSA
uniref:Uncharacterized protein n=1 Tax=Meloidogyne javanica TaxID=6303 RepID=A0A915M4S0_MELJA